MTHPRFGTPYERVMRRTEERDGCLVFTGATGSLANGGHGRVGVGSKTDGTRRTSYAHIIVWEHHNGPVPEGLEVCHTCDRGACVTIEHLWLGTHAENMADMLAKGRHNPGNHDHQRTTHCPQGHPYDEANTYLPQPGVKGGKKCRACDRERHRRSA
jgi:hypothetical protein